MKFTRNFFLTALLFIAINANAQYVGDFFNKYCDKYLSVFITVDEKTKNDKVWSEGNFLNAKEGYMLIRVNDLDKFVKSLKKLKEKTIEWANIANENGVYEIKKDIPIKFPRVQFIWEEKENEARISSIEDDDSVLSFTFNLGKGGWFTSKAIDYKNRGCDGFLIILTGEDDFDELINVLDVTRIKELVKRRRKEKSLFK